MNRFCKITPKLLVNINEIRTVSINKFFLIYKVELELKPRNISGGLFYLNTNSKNYYWHFNTEKEATDFFDEINKKIES
jgi:hypothetical protein